MRFASALGRFEAIRGRPACVAALVLGSSLACGCEGPPRALGAALDVDHRLVDAGVPTSRAPNESHVGSASGADGGVIGSTSAPAAAVRTLTERYEGVCDQDTQVQWGFFTYDATTPGDSNVTFRIRTSLTEPDLDSQAWISLARAQAIPDTQACSVWGPAPCPIDLYVVLDGAPAAHRPFAEVEIALHAESNGVASPAVQGWQLSYSCTSQ